MSITNITIASPTKIEGNLPDVGVRPLENEFYIIYTLPLKLFPPT